MSAEREEYVDDVAFENDTTKSQVEKRDDDSVVTPIDRKRTNKYTSETKNYRQLDATQIYLNDYLNTVKGCLGFVKSLLKFYKPVSWHLNLRS